MRAGECASNITRPARRRESLPAPPSHLVDVTIFAERVHSRVGRRGVRGSHAPRHRKRRAMASTRRPTRWRSRQKPSHLLKKCTHNFCNVSFYTSALKRFMRFRHISERARFTACITLLRMSMIVRTVRDSIMVQYTTLSPW